LYASKFGLRESHWIIKSLKAVERASVRLADAAVAVHEPHLDALIAHGNPREKFTIVMNLPDPAIFRHRTGQAPADDFTVIYHGTVGARHGLDVAVRAVDIARRHVPDIKLRIIGDGDDFDRVAALVDTLGVGDNIKLEQGFRRIEDVVPAIERAAVGVVPIVDDPFTRYMLPLKLLEYVAIGLPVISSSTPTIRTYFSDGMVAFTTAGDVGSLAAHMVELYHDPTARARLSREAAKFTATHHWAQEKQGYYQLIDRLVTS
jgi:glycosyltransferase involved in cell wall biosynthesis